VVDTWFDYLVNAVFVCVGYDFIRVQRHSVLYVWIGVIPSEICMEATIAVPGFYFSQFHNGYGLVRWWIPGLNG